MRTMMITSTMMMITITPNNDWKYNERGRQEEYNGSPRGNTMSGHLTSDLDALRSRNGLYQFNLIFPHLILQYSKKQNCSLVFFSPEIPLIIMMKSTYIHFILIGANIGGGKKSPKIE